MHLAADGRNAETIAVVGDAADNAAEDAPVVRGDEPIVLQTEAKGVHYGDGARAHGEDVAENAADTGGRALEGLDVARVIVRFDLEGATQPWPSAS